MIAPKQAMTLRQAVCAARDRLAGVAALAATAGQDAELLLLESLALPRSILFAYPGRLLNQREQEAFTRAVERRLRHEPVQYILGAQEFYGLRLEVTPAVLIPRPETELLVESVLDRLPHDTALRFADIGTGSGAIAIAIASRLPRARILAIDLSPAALEVARRNAQTHGVTAQIDFREGDLLAGLDANHPSFDAILSNPPYVPAGDAPTLHPQVRDFEPAQALFAGPDGLAVYRQLIPQARQLLKPAGLLALEIGAGQRTALQTLLKEWRAVQLLDDLQRIPRTVLARKP